MLDQQGPFESAEDDTVGGRISLAREAAQLSIAQAARRLGVKTASWKAWENDSAAPRSNRLTMMAGILGVSPSWLLMGRGTGPSASPASEMNTLLRELRAATTQATSAQDRVQKLVIRIDELDQALRSSAVDNEAALHP
jgi:HTH-type transcriptional regulator, cell division transcriptional repressor